MRLLIVVAASLISSSASGLEPMNPEPEEVAPGFYVCLKRPEKVMMECWEYKQFHRELKSHLEKEQAGSPKKGEI